MKDHDIPMDALRSGQTRVLIVDQESETTATLSKLLGEQTEYDIRSVGSGFAAGVECEKFRPHALLVDMHLDDIDGTQVKNNIRGNDELQMTKIIATSSKLTDGQAHQLLSNGFDGYLRKPFTVRQAIEAVERAVAIVY